MKSLDIYVNKVVALKFRGQEMSFELSHALFSSFDVDQGSRLLLKAVAAAVDPAVVGSIIDIGCGTGVLGVACARGYPGSTLLLRDRDALACLFSARNAKRNKVASAGFEHALFLDGLGDRRFDLMLCNVPAKAGPPVLDRFLRDVPGMVSDNGFGAVVVVQPIAEASLASLRESGAEVVALEAGKGHTAVVFKRGKAAGKPAPAGADAAVPDPLAIYVRSSQNLRAGRAQYRIDGIWGLPEFDTPSFDSELAIDLAENAMAGSLVRRAAFVNPGVGRVACQVQARAKGAVIDLCGRDVLALAASARNLARNAAGEVAVGLQCAFPDELPEASYDMLVELPDLTPRVDTVESSWTTATRILKRGGSFLVSMPSTAMDRFEKRKPKGFARIAVRKKKGFACAAWRLD
jgi:16S rRNA G1207 methylase RsmC